MQSKTMTGRTGAQYRSFGALNPAVTGSGYVGGDAEPMSPRPVIYTNPADVPDVLPAGSTIASVALPSQHSPQGLDPAKLGKYLEMGKALDRHGIKIADIQWERGIAMLGAGLAIGGPVGAVVGAIIFAVTQVTNFLTGTPSVWANSGPGVHAWFTTFGPQAFLDWIRANNVDQLRDLDTLRKSLVLWSIDAWKTPLGAGFRTYSNIADSVLVGLGTEELTRYGTGNPSAEHIAEMRAYSGGGMPHWIPDLYASIGIDYDASIAARKAGLPGFMMLATGAEVREGNSGEKGTTIEAGAGALLALAGLGYALSNANAR